MCRSFKGRSFQHCCVGFDSAAQVSYFPTLGLSPAIQVSGEEAIAPLDKCRFGIDVQARETRWRLV
jgi:hypothetical protein